MPKAKTLPVDSWYVVLGAALLGAAAGCYLRRWHDVKKTPMGQKCRLCEKHFHDLEAAGFESTLDMREHIDRMRKAGM